MEYIFKFNSLIASSIKDLPKPIVFVITAEIIISSHSALKMEKNRNSITNLCMKAWLYKCTITYYTQRIKLMFFEISSSLLNVQYNQVPSEVLSYCATCQNRTFFEFWCSVHHQGIAISAISTKGKA